MAKKLPARLQEILKDIGLTERQAVWDCHGTPVVLHKALEKIAAHHNIVSVSYTHLTLPTILRV